MRKLLPLVLGLGALAMAFPFVRPSRLPSQRRPGETRRPSPAAITAAEAALSVSAAAATPGTERGPRPESLAGVAATLRNRPEELRSLLLDRAFAAHLSSDEVALMIDLLPEAGIELKKAILLLLARSRDPRAQEVVLDNARHADEDGRVAALEALEGARKLGEREIALLREAAAGDGAPRARAAAAMALMRVGGARDEVVHEAREIFARERDPRARVGMVQAFSVASNVVAERELWRIGADAHENWHVRRLALALLAPAGQSRGEVAERLRSMLRLETHPELRQVLEHQLACVTADPRS